MPNISSRSEIKSLCVSEMSAQKYLPTKSEFYFLSLSCDCFPVCSLCPVFSSDSLKKLVELQLARGRKKWFYAVNH